MIRNYLRTALRQIRKHAGFSLINLTGLTIGLSCGILIWIFVRYEFSYDRFHEHGRDIYRIVMHQPWNVYQGQSLFNVTPGALKGAMDSEIPEILGAARVDTWSPVIVHEGHAFTQEGIFLVDPEFLEIFTFPLVEGDGQTALAEPFSILLTEETARKYFGDEDAVGRVLRFDNAHEFRVTGVLKDVPPNTHFPFHGLASFSSLYSMRGGRDRVERWNSNSYQTYIRVPSGYPPDVLEEKLATLYEEHRTEHKNRFVLEPLLGIHLGGNRNFEIETNGDIQYVLLFVAVGLLILLIASLNYMNLATARSIHRFREVGMRKVVGAHRGHLVHQFIGESLLFAITASLFSLVLVRWLMPLFGTIVDRELDFRMIGDGWTLAGIAILTLSVGLVSGSYPSVFLSGLPPISLFRGIARRGTRISSGLRSMLVVVQFVISVVLIVCTLIITQQLRFIREKNLGYEKEQIVCLYLRDPGLRKDWHPLETELLRHGSIFDACASAQLPAGIRSNSGGRWDGKIEDDLLPVYRTSVDYDYIEFFGMRLIEGRNFSREMSTDVDQAFILNRAAVEAIGWEEPVGKNFGFGRSEWGTVIGVIEDFHYYPLRLKIEPLALKLLDEKSRYHNAWYLSLKIGSEDVPETLRFIEETYRGFSPSYPYVYSFLDERVDRMYRTERRLGRSLTCFTWIALFIACLGLFGLASFTAEQRTREMGIRRVLGASLPTMVTLLTREFLRWVTVANLIAWPVAYFLMRRWLMEFAYRTDIRAGMFFFSAGISLCVAVLTVLTQAVRAARTNPVVSLRES